VSAKFWLQYYFGCHGTQLTVRTDLIENWQKQLPENAPNHFALNFSRQQAAFQQELQQQNITSSQFYPVVKGRLVEDQSHPRTTNCQ